MHQLELLSTWTQHNVETSLFYLLAILSIPLAFGVIFDRVIIRGGFMLIGVFGTISGMFLILQAQFLALAQIMIYAVGITLVVVIALMLTNPRLEADSSPAVPNQKLGGFLVAAFLFFTIYLALRSESWPLSNGMVSTDNVQTIGLALVTSYSLPFEFASVLLLAALMGAILLAKVNSAGPTVTVDQPDKPTVVTTRQPERQKNLAGEWVDVTRG
jgi:NAD(P)H-quinone oxidoreductase subunit 6